jgi:hypothetical protein
MIIASRESCKAREDEARKARDSLLKAAKFFEETEKNLMEAKSIMAKVNILRNLIFMRRRLLNN